MQYYCCLEIEQGPPLFLIELYFAGAQARRSTQKVSSFGNSENPFNIFYIYSWILSMVPLSSSEQNSASTRLPTKYFLESGATEGH